MANEKLTLLICHCIIRDHRVDTVNGTDTMCINKAEFCRVHHGDYIRGLLHRGLF